MMKYDITCIIAALFFIVGNVLDITHYMLMYKSHGHEHVGNNTTSTQEWKEFHTEHINEHWEIRTEYKNLELIGGIFNVIAWICFTIPIIQFTYIISNCNNNSQPQWNNITWHVIIVVISFTGSITECTARLLSLGVNHVMDWITSNDFNLSIWIDNSNVEDNIGWKTIELIHLTLRGLLLWIDSFEWLVMFIMMILLYIIIKNNIIHNGRLLILSKKFKRLTLIIAILSIIDFIAEIMRFQSWRKFAKISIFITIINRLILLPIWLYILSYQLPKMKKMLMIHNNNSNNNITKNNNNNNNNNNNDKTMSGEEDEGDDDEMIGTGKMNTTSTFT